MHISIYIRKYLDVYPLIRKDNVSTVVVVTNNDIFLEVDVINKNKHFYRGSVNYYQILRW